MIRGSIQVRTASVYGNQTIYPACASSQTIARVAGTKTITPAVIRTLLDAGIQVQQVFPNGDCLAIGSTSDLV